MLRLFTIVAASALALLLLTSTTRAQEAETTPAKQAPRQSLVELEQEARQALEEQNWVRLYATSSRLHNMRPLEPRYMINIVRAAAGVDRASTALHYMLEMQKQGLSHDFNVYPETESIRRSEAYEYINDLLIEAGVPAGEGEPFLELDLAPGNLGGVAWDTSRKRFLVGTRQEGRLLAVDDAGHAEILLEADNENGLWSIDGVAVDRNHDRLWLASSATPAFAGFEPTDLNHGALFEYDLNTLEQLGRYNLPVDGLLHELGSVAVTRAGDVYVLDRATPIVYRKELDGKRLEAFVGSSKLVALTDLAVTADNSRLFVADAVMGVLLIDPNARQSIMLAGPENLNLSGVYGVAFDGQNLIVTQSGLEPQRIMRLKLDAAGAAAEDIAPMAINLDGFDTPGAGTIREGSLYYFANHGTADPDAKLLMMRTPLDAGSDIKPPDMRQFEQAVKNKTSQ